MLTSVTGLSLEPAPAEAEFLRRELGIAWTHVDEAQIELAIRNSGRTLVAISEPEPYRELLSHMRPGSVIAFMVSDEAYSLARLELARSPSIRRVYRHYPAAPGSITEVRDAARGFMADARRAGSPARTVVPNMRSGWHVRQRMFQWQSLGDRLIPVPLGYTDTFARAYANAYQLGDDVSLLAHGADPGLQRRSSIVFRGNRGLAQRIIGCALATQVPHSDIVLVDADWSARGATDTGDPYVDQLVSSAFALCPPGFVNNESFRFYEALICGALPVEVAVATTHLGTLPWRELATVRGFSWGEALERLRLMPDTERIHRVDQARTLVRRSLHMAAARLLADLEGT